MTTGLVTVGPLLAFAAAARALPLSVLGLLQYITPTVQFLLGVLYFDEHMPPARWIGFGLVWAALAVLTTDALRRRRGPVPVVVPTQAPGQRALMRLLRGSWVSSASPSVSSSGGRYMPKRPR